MRICVSSDRIHFESETEEPPMANHVSALKRARQTEKRTAVNRSNRSTFRTSLRSLREAIQKGDAKAAGEQYKATVSAIDKSVQKGIIHKNTASRYKSRLNARVKAVGAKKSA
jgi:small subunit ribosomal protein S20